MDNGKELNAVREIVGGELVQVSCNDDTASQSQERHESFILWLPSYSFHNQTSTFPINLLILATDIFSDAYLLKQTYIHVQYINAYFN